MTLSAFVGVGLALRLWVTFVVVRRVRTQAAAQRPPLVGLDGMSDRTEPVPVDRAIPVNRDAQNVLRFLALSGTWICPARHSEDLVSFLPLIRHWATSLLPRTDLALR
jgi:hypothetical protein